MSLGDLWELLVGDRYKKGYVIHTTSNKRYMVCKILNEYEDKEEAHKDLVALLTKKKTEKALLKEFNSKKLW
jgi:ABC-type metal ion transport system substrate-binding protein